jgi:hypothetical protein
MDTSRIRPVTPVKNPEPSFQDSVYGRARDTGWASGNRWLTMIFPNSQVRDAIGMNFVVDVARLQLHANL